MTNEQILEIAEKHFDYQGGWLANTEDLLKFARELCDKRQKPVPVSERLPGPEDCDGEGKVWGIAELNAWMRVHHSMISRWKAWLPANALPLPAPQGGEVEA